MCDNQERAGNGEASLAGDLPAGVFGGREAPAGGVEADLIAKIHLRPGIGQHVGLGVDGIIRGLAQCVTIGGDSEASLAYHPAGTCRMGNGGDAVVDASLRVRGIASSEDSTALAAWWRPSDWLGKCLDNAIRGQVFMSLR